MTKIENDRIITVIQGEYHVSKLTTDRLSTVLGSCIACCMYDGQIGVGGMNHFILAQAAAGGVMDIKYGSYSMEMLINNLLKAGASKSNLQAKLFGGANVIGNNAHIGEQNALFAQDFLDREGIPLVGKSLGGNKARRIHFWPTTGAARQFIVPKSDVRENLAPAPIKPQSQAEIELF